MSEKGYKESGFTFKNSSFRYFFMYYGSMLLIVGI